MKTLITIVGGLAAASMAVPASAEVFTFYSDGNSTSNTYGNVRSYTVGGVKVQATAYSYDGSTLTNAYLGQYDKGLGVTNRTEGDGSSDNSHTVDNAGKQDFVLLVFDKAVTVSGGILTPFKTGGSTDNDAWIGWGTLANAYDTSAPITGLPTNSPIFNTLISPSNGKNVAGGLSTATPSYFTNFNTGGNSGNVWMIGAARDGTIDGFKLGSVTVSVTPTNAVPEPATWAMMIAGFGTVGVAMRRRRRIAVTFSTAAA